MNQETQAAHFQVQGQYIKDFSFENPKAPQIYGEMKEAPEIDININVNAQRVGDDLYEVILTVTAKADLKSETVFVTELAYAGLFQIANVPEEMLRPLILIECPRFLFPFARSIIANLTRESGFPPLLLQPFDFAELYRQQVEAEAANNASNDTATAPEAKEIN